MVRPDTKKIDMLIVGLILAVLYVASMTIPINSEYSDVYVKATVEKPLIGNVEFTAVEAYAQPNTLMSTPDLGNILTSGTVVVRAKTESKQAQVTVKGIYRSDDQDVRLVLKKVPKGETEVTVTLYEDDKLVATQVVTLS